MSLLDTLERVAAHRPQPFIAPIPNADWVRVFSLQADIPYQFWVTGEPGWWTVIPSSRKEGVADLGEEAQVPAVMSYLDQLPRFYVVALFRTHDQTWLCVPYNASDVAQRGWPNGEPRTLNLVRHSLRSFDIVEARSLAGLILYHDVDTHLPCPLRGYNLDDLSPDSFTEVWRNAAYIVLMKLKEELSKRELMERRSTDKGELEWQLEFMGADMLSLEEGQDGFEVRWSYDGAEFTTKIGRTKMVESAGICLDGTDRQHNLSSIVAVMQEARRLHRFDLEEESWL